MVRLNLFFLFFILFTFLIEIEPVHAGRIRLRKVKDAPKTCSVMDEDRYLTRSDKRIFGTLRNSVIVEDDVAVINDLGQKVCQWSIDKLNSLGDLNKYKFYIDEYKNTLIPFSKEKNKVRFSMINLNDCEIGEVQTADSFDIPKCESKSKKNKKNTRKRKVASKS